MGYACELIDVNYLSKGEAFAIEGVHDDGLDDSDVLSVFASTSNISFVPKEIMEKFENLERLLMSQVAMEDIEGFALEVCRVNTITFYRNKLTRIYSRGFENCVNLESLDLGDNRIEVIPREAFEGLPNLQSLVIDNNPIKVINPTVFEKLTNLRALYSLNIEVAEILPQFFSNFKRIEWIYFGSSLPRRRKKIATGTFKSLPELIYLYVRGNNGDEMEIEEAAFEDLPSLWSLDLSGNSIKRLNSNSFKGLENLGWLYLQENQIDKVERTLLSNFPKLERLNVKENLCINQTYFSDDEPLDERLLEDFEDCFANWDDATSTSSSTESQISLSTETTNKIGSTVLTTTQGSSAAMPSILQIAISYCICSFLLKSHPI